MRVSLSDYNKDPLDASLNPVYAQPIFMDVGSVAGLVSTFSSAAGSGEEKSRELVLQLLQHTPAPFSRDQFLPGHITCTGLVLHPERDAFLIVHHRRLDRWLLPGGHVEPEDPEIWETARREVVEETGARIVSAGVPALMGVDVHGIPANHREPFHLHHDLIFEFRAASIKMTPAEEVRQVAWCDLNTRESYDLPGNILIALRRALSR
jgi:8-oxo-dGTP pyrophosphatase MutT (NUDIX family)